MPLQPTSAGPAPATPTDRLFLALFPDAAAAERIIELAVAQRARHGLRGRVLRSERLHVTLFHLGDSVGLRHDVIDAVAGAAAALQAPPFQVAFDQVASFPGRRRDRPFVLKASGGNQPLHAFRTRLGDALAEAKLDRFVTPIFEPHVTLARDPTVVAPEAVEPVSWTAREFVLVHSLLGQGRYVPLARWPLTGP